MVSKKSRSVVRVNKHRKLRNRLLAIDSHLTAFNEPVRLSS